MSLLSYLSPNLQPTLGVVLLWAAGAVAAVAVVVGVVAFKGRTSPALQQPPAEPEIPVASRRRVSQGALWGGAAALIAVIALWALFDRLAAQDQAATRRALDTRAAELTMQAIAPGSALACLDAVANAAVEAGCEKALFANPQATAATIAYVDARLTLLADGLALAAHDPGYAMSLERLRRAIETDRFGVVAHVLETRGCTATDCPAFRLMRDNSRVAANLNGRTFDANVVLHAASWKSDEVAEPGVVVSSAAPPPAAGVAAAPAAATPLVTTGTGHPMSAKYDFPSAASIPPVSIMNAEPAPKPESAAKPPAQHRQTAREAAPKAKEAAKETAKEQPPKEPSREAPPPTSLAPPAAAPAGTLFNPR